MNLEAAPSPLQHQVRFNKSFICKLLPKKESCFVPPVDSPKLRVIQLVLTSPTQKLRGAAAFCRVPLERFVSRPYLYSLLNGPFFSKQKTNESIDFFLWSIFDYT